MLTQEISGRRQYITGASNGPGHTCLQEQLAEITLKTFASTFRKGNEKERERKLEMALQSFLRYMQTQ